MRYQIMEETIDDEELGQRRTYGIIAEAAEVRDISEDREVVERLVELLNTRQVSLKHFKDVVEDFLTK